MEHLMQINAESATVLHRIPIWIAIIMQKWYFLCPNFCTIGFNTRSFGLPLLFWISGALVINAGSFCWCHRGSLYANLVQAGCTTKECNMYWNLWYNHQHQKIHNRHDQTTPRTGCCAISPPSLLVLSVLSWTAPWEKGAHQHCGTCKYHNDAQSTQIDDIEKWWHPIGFTPNLSKLLGYKSLQQIRLLSPEVDPLSIWSGQQKFHNTCST